MRLPERKPQHHDDAQEKFLCPEHVCFMFVISEQVRAERGDRNGFLKSLHLTVKDRKQSVRVQWD